MTNPLHDDVNHTFEVQCFDAVGRRDKRFGGKYRCLSDAIFAGQMYVKEGEAASYRVLRELYNSANPPKERWEPK